MRAFGISSFSKSRGQYTPTPDQVANDLAWKPWMKMMLNGHVSTVMRQETSMISYPTSMFPSLGV